MRRPRLLLPRRPCGEHAQVAIDLHGIGIDDHPVMGFGKRKRQGRLAARGRACDKHRLIPQRIHPMSLVAAITERAMRGEIEFESALRERVALLKGLPVGVADEVVAKRITLTPGGRELVATMRAHGAFTCLISGGFTLFTNAVARMIGFQENRGNELLTEAGNLSGKVAEPILGRAAKLAALVELREAFDLDDLD